MEGRLLRETSVTLESQTALTILRAIGGSVTARDIMAVEELLKIYRDQTVDYQQTPLLVVAQFVCGKLGVSLEQLVTGVRRRRVVRARWLVCSLGYTELKMSYAEIGEELHLHHTSVMHGIQHCDPDDLAAMSAMVTGRVPRPELPDGRSG